MDKINDGGPAFPQDLQGRRGDDPQYQGMSLRDWLIGQALAGLCSNLASYEEQSKVERAACAIMQADETLRLMQGGFNRD